MLSEEPQVVFVHDSRESAGLELNELNPTDTLVELYNDPVYLLFIFILLFYLCY